MAKIQIRNSFITSSAQITISSSLVRFSDQIRAKGLTGSFNASGTGTNIFVQSGNSFGTTALLGTNDNQPLALETNGGERMRITNTGCVGIGTTSVRSNSLLDVYGSGVFGTSAYGFYLGTDATGAFLDAGTQLIRMFAGQTERIRIQADGNVGIGTTSPTGELHVYGSQPAFRIQSSVNGNMQFGQWDTTYNRIQSSGRDFLLISTDATNLIFSTNTTERMRITSGGNVGIGTTSPAYKLDIYGSTPRIHLKETGLSYATLDVENNAGSFYFGIDNSSGTGFGGAAYAGTIYKQGAYPISIWTNAVERMRITSTGNIGINAADPDGTTLRIVPFSTDVVQRVLHIGYAGSMSSGTHGSYISFGNGNPDSYQLARIASYYEGATYRGSLRFYTNSNTDGANPTERMRVDYTGNVGIGTTSPNANLHVSGTFQVGNGTNFGNKFTIYESFASGKIGFCMRDTTGDDIYSILCNSTTGEVRLIADDDNSVAFMTFYMNASERMRITTAGNVGIGTSSPIYKLDNYNDTIRYTLRTSEKTLAVGFTNGVANQKVDITFDVAPGNIIFWGNLEVEITDGYNNQLSTGKLIKVFALGCNPATGTGPYSPALFDNTSYYTAAYGAVADNWAIDGIFFNTTTGKYYFTIIHRVSTGNTPIIKIRGFGYDASSSNNIVNLTAGAVYTTNTTVYYKPVVETLQSRIGYNGNINQSADLIVQGAVGIGTTAPTYKLDVYQTSNDSVIRSKTTTAGAYVYLDSGTDGYFGLNLINAGTAKWFIGSYGTTSFTITRGIADTEYFRINTSGNVGIGTTSPKQKLDIAGAGAGSIGLTNTGTTGYSEVIFYEGSSVKADIWVNGSAQSNYAGANSMNIYQNSNAPIAFYTNGTNERMRITSGGTLQLNTQATYGSMTYEPSITYTRSGQTGVGGIYFGNSYNSNNNVGLQLRVSNDATQIEALTINYTGNVGIGTTSPVVKLHIEGNDIRLNTEGSYAEKSLYFRYSDNAKIMSDSYLTFLTSGTPAERMRITSVGNVGIGTTTVRGLLHVSGDIIRDTNLPYSWGTSAPHRTFAGAYSYANGGVNGVARYLLLWPQITNVNGQNGRFVNARLVVSRGASHAYNDTIIGDIVASAGYNSSANLYNYTPLIGSQLYFYNIVYNSVTYLAISLPISDFRWELTGYYGIEETAYYSPTFVYANTSGVGTITQLTDYTNESAAIYNKGGNIGIGTTTTTGLLTLNGTYPQLTANNPSTGSGVVIQLKDNGRDAGFMGHSTTTARLQFGSRGSSTAHMTISGDGDVGIGTTAPTNQANYRFLQVNGTNSAVIETMVGGSRIGGFDSAANVLYVGTIGSYPVVFRTAVNEKMRIATDGNVGIGTSSPLLKLDVRGALNVGGSTDGIWLGNVGDNSAYDNVKLYYTGYNSGSPRVYLTPKTQPGSGNINTYLYLQSNVVGGPGSNTMGLLVDGNVGIGTASPKNKLSVISSDSTSYYNSTAPVATFQGVSPSTILVAVDGNVDGYYAELKLGNAQSTYYPYSAYIRGIQGSGIDYYRLEFGTAAGSAASTRMTIANDGNVGIGTSSPGAKLDVNGNTFVRSGYGLYSNIIGPYTGDLTFYTGGTEKMRIDSSGNLLISTTTSPSHTGISLGSTGVVRQLLGGMLNTSWRIRERDVVDAVAITTNINDAGTQDSAARSSWKLRMGWGNGQDNLVIARSPAGSNSFSDLFYVKSDGNVGIGTTGPADKLDVVGTTRTDKLRSNGVVYLGITGTKSSNASAFNMFDINNTGGNQTIEIVLSHHHSGGGQHGSFRRTILALNSYTDYIILEDTSTNFGGGLGFTITRTNAATIRIGWLGATSFASSYVFTGWVKGSGDYTITNVGMDTLDGA